MKFFTSKCEIVTWNVKNVTWNVKLLPLEIGTNEEGVRNVTLTFHGVAIGQYPHVCKEDVMDNWMLCYWVVACPDEAKTKPTSRRKLVSRGTRQRCPSGA